MKMKLSGVVESIKLNELLAAATPAICSWTQTNRHMDIVLHKVN